MSTLNGDGPCDGCGTNQNIVWFTDNVVWNAIVRGDPAWTNNEPILCIHCFVINAERRGFAPTSWRLTPEWPWRISDPNAVPS